MQFDGPLGPAEARLGKQVQAQVDGGGIQRINRFLEFRAERLLRIEGAGAPDEQLGQIVLNYSRQKGRPEIKF
jgi:hypothetical protein